MGVFGPQLVCTMVMSSILSKVIPHWSPGQWILCHTGLSYYLHPTDDQLRDNPKKKINTNKNNTKLLDNENDGTFTVLPKNIDVDLQKVPVTQVEVLQLRFFADYQWLVDFSICAVIVYIVTEVYLSQSPGHNEVNLSMIWCLLLLAFVLKTLFSVTLVYFKSSAGDGEKALVVLALLCYLLLAMMILIVSENKLELGLEEAYETFNTSATQFMRFQDITSVGVMSKMSFKGVVAVSCAVLGACFAFPGLRLGKMHWDAIRAYSCRRVVLALLHLSFLAPGLVALLWLRPVARHYLVVHSWPPHNRPLLSSDCFAVARVVCVLLACAVRAVVLPVYLQVYLDMAKTRLEEQRKHAGKITNKQIQRQVAGVFYYLCVVALQYLLPLLLVLVLTLLLKTLGGLHWMALTDPSGFVSAECGLEEVVEGGSAPALDSQASASQTTEAITLSFQELRKVLVPELWRGLLGFWVWWTSFVWFVSSLFGLMYQRYFTAG